MSKILKNYFKKGILCPELFGSLYLTLPLESEIDALDIGPFEKFGLIVNEDKSFSLDKIDVCLPSIFSMGIRDIYDELHKLYGDEYAKYNEEKIKKEKTNFYNKLRKEGVVECSNLWLEHKSREIISSAIESSTYEITTYHEPYQKFIKETKGYLEELVSNVHKDGVTNENEIRTTGSYINLFSASFNKSILEQIAKSKATEQGSEEIYDEIFDYKVVAPVFDKICEELSGAIPKIIHPNISALSKPGLSIIMDLNEVNYQKLIRKIAALGSDLSYKDFSEIQKSQSQTVKELSFSKERFKNKFKINEPLDKEDNSNLEILLRDKYRIQNMLLYSAVIIKELIDSPSSSKDEKKKREEYAKLAYELKKAEIFKFIYDNLNLIHESQSEKVEEERAKNQNKKRLYNFVNPESFKDLKMTVLSVDAVKSSENPNSLEINDYFLFGKNSLFAKVIKDYEMEAISEIGDKATAYAKDLSVVSALLSSLNFLRRHTDEAQKGDVKRLTDGKEYRHGVGLYTGSGDEFKMTRSQPFIQLAVEVGETHINMDSYKKEMSEEEAKKHRWLNQNKIYFASNPEIKEEDFIEILKQQLSLLQRHYKEFYERHLRIMLPKGTYDALYMLKEAGIEDISLKCIDNENLRGLDEKKKLSDEDMIVSLIDNGKTAHSYYGKQVMKVFNDYYSNPTKKQLAMVHKHINNLAGKSYYSPLFAVDYPFAKKVGSGLYKSGLKILPTFRVFYSKEDIEQDAAQEAEKLDKLLGSRKLSELLEDVDSSSKKSKEGKK